MIRDRSDELWERFLACSRRERSDDEATGRDTAEKVGPSSETDPMFVFSQGARQVCAAATEAVTATQSSLVAGLGTVLSGADPTEAEAHLMVSDTMLASAAAATAAFAGIVAGAAGRDGTDALRHFREVAAIIDGRVARTRLDLTVLREVLESYRTAKAAPAASWLADASAGLLGAEAGGDEAGGAQPSSLGKSSVVDAATTALRTQKGALEGLLQRSGDSVASAVLSIARRTAASGGNRPGGPTVSSAASTGKQHTNAPAFVYTDEEREQLAGERAAMLLEERASAGAAAKDVERTIAELAKLTSLVQVRVREQDECLAVVERNAEDARTAIEGAASELAKPAPSVSSTMWLAGCLWVASISLLLANYVIR